MTCAEHEEKTSVHAETDVGCLSRNNMFLVRSAAVQVAAAFSKRADQTEQMPLQHSQDGARCFTQPLWFKIRRARATFAVIATFIHISPYNVVASAAVAAAVAISV